MKIILAEPRGFCAGVERAIKTIEQALENLTPPIYVNHEIVHNSHVIKYFKEKGVFFVENIDDVPEKSTLIFNAHGVPPQLTEKAKKKKLNIIDATCPLVSKVHFEALRYFQQGFEIILIGHAGHSEVIGIVGHAPKNIHLVENISDVQKLFFQKETPLAYITQTTLSIDDCQEIVTALKEKFPNITEPKKSDICYATTNRQLAVKHISNKAESIIIVGSKNSSNSNRLREVAESSGIKSYLINSGNEITKEWFRGDETIGISAGASTPEAIIQGVIDRLKDLFSVEDVSVYIDQEEHVDFAMPIITKI